VRGGVTDINPARAQADHSPLLFRVYGDEGPPLAERPRSQLTRQREQHAPHQVNEGNNVMLARVFGRIGPRLNPNRPISRDAAPAAWPGVTVASPSPWDPRLYAGSAVVAWVVSNIQSITITSHQVQVLFH